MGLFSFGEVTFSLTRASNLIKNQDQEQLESNCGGFLKGHASQISKILMTKNQDLFYSLGLEDNTLIEWRSRNIFNSFITQNLVENVNEYFDTLKNNTNFENAGLMQPSDQTNISDECLIRELDYCFESGITDKVKDQFVLFRGANQKTLNSCKFTSIQSFNDSKDFFAKRAPPFSLHLEYIYGFQVNIFFLNMR